MADCAVCRHPKRLQIDKALVAGEPVRSIASRFGAHYSAVHRHRPHVDATILKAKENQDLAIGNELLVEVLARENETQEMYSIAKDMIHVAKAAGNTREVRANIKTAVAVLSEDRAHKELRGELTGVLKRGQVNVNVMTQINQMAGSLPRAQVADAQVIDARAIDAPPRADALYNNDTLDTFDGPDGAD